MTFMRQRGFTLIEMVVVMGIMGAIIPVLAPTIYQLTRHTDRSTTRVTALVHIENAARWLGRDIPQAQETDLVDGDPPVTSMTLYWTDWTDANNYDSYSQSGRVERRHRINYAWDDVASTLTRTYDLCGDWDSTAQTCNVAWSTPDVKTVASYVTNAGFSLSTEMVTADLTSQPKGVGWPGESRSYLLYATLVVSGGSPIQ